MSHRRARPILCPCSKSCLPIFNGMAGDDRIKTGDMMEGYSGDCIGQGDRVEYVVGGHVHRNDMNHCIFTPLKGVIRYNINEDDVGSMLQMAQSVLYELHGKPKCSECGDGGRWTHFVVRDGKKRCCRCDYKFVMKAVASESQARRNEYTTGT